MTAGSTQAPPDAGEMVPSPRQTAIDPAALDPAALDLEAVEAAAAEQAEPPAIDETTINRATTSSSAVWIALQTWGNRLASFAVFVVLGHLLAPSDFGLVAVASAFVAMTGLLLDRGLTAGLIQRKEIDQRILSTGFWSGMASGTVLAVGACVAAPYVARWLGQPRLTGLLIVLAFTFPCSAAEMVPQALLQRKFQFRKLAIRRLAAVAVSAVVGVGCAIGGAGPYALVIQSLSFSVVSAVVLYLTSGWRPSFVYDRKAFRETRGFSVHVFLLNLLNFGLTQMDKLLLSPLVGAVSLGYYTVSQKIQLTVQDVTVTVIGSIAFPAFSRLRHDIVALRSALLRMSKVTSILILPVFILLGVAAKDIVPTVFGAQWAPTVHLTEILSAVAALGTFTLFDRSILLSVGRPRTELVITAAAAVANALVIVSLYHHGITVVAVGLLIRAAAFYPVRARIITGAVGLPTLTFIRQSASSIAAGAVASVGVLAVQHVGGSIPVVLRILVEGLVFAVLYLGALTLIDRRGLADSLGAAGDAVGAARRFPVLGRLQAKLAG